MQEKFQFIVNICDCYQTTFYTTYTHENEEEKNKNRQIILRDASLSSLVLLQINISRVRLGCVMERVEKFSIFLFLSRSLAA